MTITENPAENSNAKTCAVLVARLDELIERFKGKLVYMNGAFFLTRKGAMLINIMSEDEVGLIVAVGKNDPKSPMFWSQYNINNFVDAEEYFTNVKENVISVLGTP